MALWGKGDPRWIVEERPDATNVNNWHWTEKNATPWSEVRIKQLLKGLKIVNDQGSSEITDVTKLSGEASANNRKAKLIFFYEWEITCSWLGKLVNCDKSFEGELHIPNLSDENNVNDLDISFTVKDESKQAYDLKMFMFEHATEPVKTALQKYIVELKAEFSKGMILPSGGTSGDANSKKSDAPPQEVTINARSKPIAHNDTSNSNTNSIGTKVSTSTISLQSDFKCRAEDLYRALTLQDMVQAFSNGPAVVDPVKHGKFSLYHGNVEGKFLELVTNEKLVMEWRMRSWPSGHSSIVTITIKEGSDETTLLLNQSGVPTELKDSTEDGWNRHYFDALKRTFGFGAYLL